MARKDTFVLEIHRPYISNTIDSIERFYDLAKNKKERKKKENMRKEICPLPFRCGGGIPRISIM